MLLAGSGKALALGFVLAFASVAGAEADSASPHNLSLQGSLRGRCQAEREQGRFNEAISLCEAALARDPGAENLVALSASLSARGGTEDLARAASLADRALALAPSSEEALMQRLELAVLEGDLPAALELVGPLSGAREGRAHALVAHLALEAGEPALAFDQAERAVARAPEDYRAQVSLARAAAAVGASSELAAASARLLALAPDAPFGHFAAALLAAEQGRDDEARAAVERARERGMDAESCEALLSRLPPTLPLVSGFLGPMLGVLLLLLLGLLGLHAASWGLSEALLRRGEAGPTRLCRRCLALTLSYAYLCLPVAGLLTIALVAASLQTLLAVGSLSLGLALPLLFVGATVLFGVVEAAFLRPRRAEAARLDLGTHKALSALLTGTTEALGARPIERVSLSVGAALHAVDEGTLAAVLRGRGVRTLHIGVALLEGLEVSGFGALLARELGPRDGVGRGLARSLDAALHSMEQTLRDSGAATLLNPAFFMLRISRWTIARVTRGPSVVDGRRADIEAAGLYGGLTLAVALRHALAARARFAAHAAATLDELVASQARLDNFYAYRTARPIDHAALDARIERSWSEPPPGGQSPATNAARISSIPRSTACPVGPDEHAPAWSLLRSRDAVEAKMTRLVRYDLARLGVAIGSSDELAVG